jgi:hypothetical protein
VIRGGPLDLSRRDSQDALDGDPALTIVASSHPGVYARHAIRTPSAASGEFRVNPLYAVETTGDRLQLRLRFPTPDYEDEYRACRQYLPEEAVIDAEALRALEAGHVPASLAEMVRQRVIVDLPRKYY